ncbi:MAG: hypothetical protein GX640_19340 [Fibrobacter sp.]|nr:hypothetical protein [Fibrobacter sp.]
MQLQLSPSLPPKSVIDSLNMIIAITDSQSNVSATYNNTLKSIKPGKTFKSQLDLTDLLNAWPQSIILNSQIDLPSGSGVDIYNYKDPFGNYSPTLSMGVSVKWSLTIPFSWKILDTIKTELEKSEFFLEDLDLSWVNKFDNLDVKMKINFFNNTSLHFILHGIAATENHLSELDDFSFHEILSGNDTTTINNNFLSRLFGSQGLIIPPRGDSSEVSFQLNEQVLKALFAGEKCFIRWFLIIPYSNSDALQNNDFLKLTATALIRGTGNSDSLLYWTNDSN